MQMTPSNVKTSMASVPHLIVDMKNDLTRDVSSIVDTFHYLQISPSLFLASTILFPISILFSVIVMTKFNLYKRLNHFGSFWTYVYNTKVIEGVDQWVPNAETR